MELKKTISFVDFIDVQTRLVLLPRIEEEGIGAVVASYYDDDDDDKLLLDDSLKGYILTGMQGCEENQWKEQDFSAILASIREAEMTPIVLHFEAPEEESFAEQAANSVCAKETDIEKESLLEEKKEEEDLFEEEKKLDEEEEDTTSSPTSITAHEDYSSAQEEEEEGVFSTPKCCDSPPETTTTTTLTNSYLSVNLSNWTSRVSAAATSAAAMARAAAQERSKQHQANHRAASSNNRESAKFSIFVQSPTGAFLEMNGSGETRPTNASLLIVRVSQQQPADERNCKFQWYRWNANSETCWETLEGATRAAFQPSATEVGYRLRCVITPIQQDHDEEDVTQSSPVICETTQTVTAALSLFNGARQALVRGAQFAGLTGRGNAKGRTFRVKIEMSSFRKRVVSAVTLYQVAGNTAEPIHEKPIRCVWAAADHGHAKNFDLILAGRAESASMVAALCTDGKFQLQAPNRLARESLLLAIGIANYKGKPVDLDAGMILYKHHSEDDDDVLSSEDELSVHSSSSSSDSGFPFSSSSSRHGRPPLSLRSKASSPHQRSTSLDSPRMISVQEERELERELELLRSKLARKDKVISELHRQITCSDESLRSSEHKLAAAEAELQRSQNVNDKLQQSLTTAGKQIERHDQTLQQVRGALEVKVSTLESELHVQNERIAALEKANRTLANEKDVLSAAVEARESKLSKMADLQASFNEVSAQVAKQKEYQKEVDEANKRCSEAKAAVERIAQSKLEVQEELRQSKTQIESLNQQLQLEISKTASHKSELEKEKMKIQKLKAERNSYKQKGDSLAKEMSRVCRHGRTVREVERILADDVTRRQEAELLREQKRKALEQAEYYRTAYEQSLAVQKMAGLDHDSGKLLQRNAELERLLSELTEYVTAKEMQLETMKQVNDALQSELRDLAKASMSKNDI